MFKSRKEDLIFELDNLESNTSKSLIVHHLDVPFLADVLNLEGWEAKLAAMLLKEVVAIYIGHHNGLAIYASTASEKGSYILTQKPRTHKEELVFTELKEVL